MENSKRKNKAINKRRKTPVGDRVVVLLLLRQLMSDYKGFITRYKWIELRNRLRKIADTRGLENKLHHLYQPDTDMADIVCEDFENSKTMIVKDLTEIFNDAFSLAIEISNLKEDK